LIEAAAAGSFSRIITPLIKRELAEQGLSFISAAKSILTRAKTKHARGRSSVRLGVAIHYYEHVNEGHTLTKANGVRTNLRRRQGGKRRSERSGNQKR
jgi:hypothetical protein